MPDTPQLRAHFAHHAAIPTRFHDNDIYGHINNVIYYSMFDTIINSYLIAQGGLEMVTGEVLGVAVETGCRFFRSIAFPEVVDARLRVGHLGTTSVRYEIGLFTEGDETPAALGHFVHVFISRKTRTKVGIPDRLRDALSRLQMGASQI